ncbi:MAG: hypothetical protein MZW92_30230 [Comamonadaceae bacterium]|nr:hypothetical protein [Comamonadaceae bacterium]
MTVNATARRREQQQRARAGTALGFVDVHRRAHPAGSPRPPPAARRGGRPDRAQQPCCSAPGDDRCAWTCASPSRAGRASRTVSRLGRPARRGASVGTRPHGHAVQS